jgi:hypothetical protein
MRISVINCTNGLLSDDEVQKALRAVNRQITEDFAPYWNLNGMLRLEGRSAGRPDYENPTDMQGEAIIYLWDESNIADALGYHDANHRGIPYGFVFIDIATEIGEAWTVTLSHEALELIGDRQANKLVSGPHPRESEGGRTVYHWHEMCDAVQSETYIIDGIEVSNFVLPLYFTEGAEPGSRNDFLGGTGSEGMATKSLGSFGTKPGGYIGYFDPESGEHETWFHPSDGSELDIGDAATPELGGADDRQARPGTPEYRQQRKNKARMARRGNRYDAHKSSLPAGEAPLDKSSEEVTFSGQAVSLNVAGRGISVSSDTTGIRIRKAGSYTSAIGRQSKGYFAHDIYADSQQVNAELDSAGFQELGAVEIDPDSALTERDSESSSGTPCLKFSIPQVGDEWMLALVEIDGVIFWLHPRFNAETKQFEFNVRTRMDDSVTGRRGFLGKITKSVIRFMRTTVQDFKDDIEKKVTKFLTENIEDHAFGKEEPAIWKEFKLVKSPKNK